MPRGADGIVTDGVYHAASHRSDGTMRYMPGAPVDIRAVERELDSELPALARQVISRYQDSREPETRAFLERPDGREQHQTSWHQWGIITHTRVFLRHFEQDIPRYLRDWEMWEEVDGVLRQTVEGVSRWDLLRLAILL